MTDRAAVAAEAKVTQDMKRASLASQPPTPKYNTRCPMWSETYVGLMWMFHSSYPATHSAKLSSGHAELGRQWNSQNQSQPNPGSRCDGSTCTVPPVNGSLPDTKSLHCVTKLFWQRSSGSTRVTTSPEWFYVIGECGRSTLQAKETQYIRKGCCEKALFPGIGVIPREEERRKDNAIMGMYSQRVKSEALRTKFPTKLYKAETRGFS